jgi:hypothetical protein
MQMERSGKRPENVQMIFPKTISALAGETGVTHGNRMRHDRGDSSRLSPIIPEVEYSEMKARASGAVRWRRGNGAE